MTVHFTSDLHIGHKFVAAARMNGGDYEAFAGMDRSLITPETVDEHDNMLAENFDRVVKKDDVVWFLGDLTGGGNIERGLDWIKARMGTWHMITGNHDKPHPMNRDSAKYQKIFLTAFESVQMAARRKVTLSDGTHTNVMLSHFPFSTDHSPEARYMEWRLRDEGGVILHGHTHDTTKVSPDGREIHVGVDAHEFAPVSLDWVTEMVANYMGVND